MGWRNTKHKLFKQLMHRKAISSKMPQTKAEARQACIEAAQKHRITKLPVGKSTQTQRGQRYNRSGHALIR